VYVNFYVKSTQDVYLDFYIDFVKLNLYYIKYIIYKYVTILNCVLCQHSPVSLGMKDESSATVILFGFQFAFTLLALSTAEC